MKVAREIYLYLLCSMSALEGKNAKAASGG